MREIIGVQTPILPKLPGRQLLAHRSFLLLLSQGNQLFCPSNLLIDYLK